MNEIEKEQIKDPDMPPEPFAFESTQVRDMTLSGEKDVLTINTETEIVEHDAITSD